MRRGSVLAAIAMAVAVSMQLTPAFAGAVPEDQDTGRAATEWRTETVKGGFGEGQHVSELLAASPRDDTPLPAQRDVLTATVERGGSGFAASAPENDGRAEDDGEACYSAPHGQWTESVPTGDFDGDGKSDVVTFQTSQGEWRSPGPITITGRRGETGQALWTLTARFDVLYRLMDLTGDGVEELVLFECSARRYTFEEDPLVHSHAFQTIQVIGLDSGNALWEKTITAEMSSSGIKDEVTQLLPVAEAGGTPGPDLLVGTLDSRQPDGSVLRARFLDGSTGAAIVTREFKDVYGTRSGPWVLPMDDVSGDGKVDLVVVRPALTAVVDGARDIEVWPLEGEALWRKTMAANTVYVYPVPLEGERITELFTLAQGWFAGGSPSIHILEGATGEERWTEPVTGGGFTLAGDVDGDGVEDIHHLQGRRLRALSGSTAEVLLDTELPMEEEAGTPQLCLCFTDLDGDGIRDIFSEKLITNDWGLWLSTMFAAYSGADGQKLWGMHLDLPDDLRLLHGDADDDGGDDVVLLDYSGDEEDPPAFTAVTVLNGATAAPSQTLYERPEAGVFSVAVADVGGGAERELLAAFRWWEEDTVQFGYIAAAEGGRLWSVPQRVTSIDLHSAPQQRTILLTATLLDEYGSEVTGRWVSFTSAGSPVGAAMTNNRGVAKIEIPRSAAKAPLGAAFAGDTSYLASQT